MDENGLYLNLLLSDLVLRKKVLFGGEGKVVGWDFIFLCMCSVGVS